MVVVDTHAHVLTYKRMERFQFYNKYIVMICNSEVKSKKRPICLYYSSEKCETLEYFLRYSNTFRIFFTRLFLKYHRNIHDLLKNSHLHFVYGNDEIIIAYSRDYIFYYFTIAQLNDKQV